MSYKRNSNNAAEENDDVDSQSNHLNKKIRVETEKNEENGRPQKKNGLPSKSNFAKKTIVTGSTTTMSTSTTSTTTTTTTTTTSTIKNNKTTYSNPLKGERLTPTTPRNAISDNLRDDFETPASQKLGITDYQYMKEREQVRSIMMNWTPTQRDLFFSVVEPEILKSAKKIRPRSTILIPLSMLLAVFKFLDMKSLIICNQVCTQWQNVIDKNSNFLWKPFYFKKRGWRRPKLLPSIEYRQLKQAFANLKPGAQIVKVEGNENHHNSVAPATSGVFYRRRTINSDVLTPQSSQRRQSRRAGRRSRPVSPPMLPTSHQSRLSPNQKQQANFSYQTGEPNNKSTYFESVDCDDMISEVSLDKKPPGYYKVAYHQAYMLYHLSRQNIQNGEYDVEVIDGQSSGIYCLQYDDKKLVSGSRDQKVRIWDLATKQCIKTLTGHVGSVLCLQYIDNLLVTGSSDGTVRIWDLESEVCTQVIRDHSDSVLNLQFDENHLVTCSKDNFVCLFEFVKSATGTVTAKLAYRLAQHTSHVNAVQMNEKFIVSASADSTIKVFHRENGRLFHTLKYHSRGIACLHFDYPYVVAGSADQTISLWNVLTGKLIRVLSDHHDLVRCIRIHGDYIVSGSYDMRIKIWDFHTGACLRSLFEHENRVFKIQFDGLTMISTSMDNNIHFWNFLTPFVLGSSNKATSEVEHPSGADDGSTLESLRYRNGIDNTQVGIDIHVVSDDDDGDGDGDDTGASAVANASTSASTRTSRTGSNRRESRSTSRTRNRTEPYQRPTTSSRRRPAAEQTPTRSRPITPRTRSRASTILSQTPVEDSLPRSFPPYLEVNAIEREEPSSPLTASRNARSRSRSIEPVATSSSTTSSGSMESSSSLTTLATGDSSPIIITDSPSRVRRSTRSSSRSK